METLESLIDTAQQEKNLYDSIPNKYRKRVKNMVSKCKSKAVCDFRGGVGVYWVVKNVTTLVMCGVVLRMC